jgi:hypothetical protein
MQMADWQVRTLASGHQLGSLNDIAVEFLRHQGVHQGLQIVYAQVIDMDENARNPQSQSEENQDG